LELAFGLSKRKSRKASEFADISQGRPRLRAVLPNSILLLG